MVAHGTSESTANAANLLNPTFLPPYLPPIYPVEQESYLRNLVLFKKWHLPSLRVVLTAGLSQVENFTFSKFSINEGVVN